MAAEATTRVKESSAVTGNRRTFAPVAGICGCVSEQIPLIQIMRDLRPRTKQRINPVSRKHDSLLYAMFPQLEVFSLTRPV